MVFQRIVAARQVARIGRRLGRGCLALVFLAAALSPGAAVSADRGGDYAAARPASAAAQPKSAAVRIRIGVVSDGIVRVTPEDLAAAGVDPATVDPTTFALSSLGAPVAIQVSGEADGRFDPGDAVDFFGRRFRGPEMDQKYTDERVYWLDAGGTRGLRVAGTPAAPQGDLTPPADFADTAHAEEDRIWWALHSLTMDTQDTWFWTRLLPPTGAGQVATATLPYALGDPAPGYTATLRLEAISRSYGSYTIDPDHLTTIGLNDMRLAERTWDGKMRVVLTATAPAGLLVSGANTLTVAATNVQTVLDDVYVNYWEIDYRRLFRAAGGRLAFRSEQAGPQEYRVDGWTSGQVAIWDISDPARPAALTGASVEPDGAGFSLRFRTAAPAGSHFWLQEVGALARPAGIRLRPPTGLRDVPGGADVVIVTRPLFALAVERLAAWHRAHGRRVLIADLQDVCDEFNDGIYHPKAVPAMLAWGTEHWAGAPPAYLTLVGDGHWNFKGFSPDLYPPQPNPIPPFLAWTDPSQGEVPADTLYGDLNGDTAPEVAVGRLAVNTLDEAQTVVDKIVNYDESIRIQGWQHRALFVADAAEVGNDFPGVSDQAIRTLLPADLKPLRVYLGVNVADGAAARAVISQAINDGVWLVQYTGHGAPERWSGRLIWRLPEIAALHNGDRLPIVMTFNCLDGYFVLQTPDKFSVAEMMQRRPGGGSVASISPSGLGFTDEQAVFRQLLMDALFKDGVRELGSALMLAKQRLYARWGPHNLIATMTLFGDPAMRVPVAARSYYLPIGANGR